MEFNIHYWLKIILKICLNNTIRWVFLKDKMIKKIDRQVHRYANIIVNHINKLWNTEAFFLKSENNIQNYWYLEAYHSFQRINN